MKAVELIEKVVGVLAALLGLAGYVLVIGSAVLWLRLDQADLPPEVPVALASREELIVLGAKAVAVWLALTASFAGLGAWIVTGDPERRRFGYGEAGLALTVTLSTLLAVGTDRTELLLFPAVAAGVAVVGALIAWPSLEAVGAALLPAIVGTVLALALAALDGNDAATAVGATAIFVVLLLATPYLQSSRSRQGANQAALARLQREGRDKQPSFAALVAALAEQSRPRPTALVWIERIAIVTITLLLIGAAAVASQLDHKENFNKALVSLTNGDCLVGTYVTRGKDLLVIAEPELPGPDNPRVTALPMKEVLEVQIYGASTEGEILQLDDECKRNAEERMVEPAPKQAAPSPH